MKTKVLFAAVLFTLLFLPGAVLKAQTTQDADFEFDDTGVPAATVSSGATDPVPVQAGSIVCKNGHWISGPLTCSVQHIDALVGPLAFCSRIQIGGKWYHIVKVRRVPGKIIITVRPI